MKHLAPIGSTFRRVLSRFRQERGGNLSITFVFAAIPIVFALGATADYTFATKLRSHMNAAADAAALYAVTPRMMAQTTTVAQLAAQQLFMTQVSGLRELSFNPPTVGSLSIQVSDANVNNQRVRTATVSYEAFYTTTFSQVLKKNTIGIGGTATSTASTSPNIDFYLMLDTSPSMAIPATQDGINYVVAQTPYQDNGNGCAFACHESNPAAESGNASRSKPQFGNPGCPDDPLRRSGPCLDNYAIAKNAVPPILLRIDLVNQAVVNLVDTASSTAASTGAAYKLAGYTFDVAVANPIPLQLPTSATKTQAAAGINMLEVASENSINGDQNTVFDGTTGAFTVVTTAMKAAYGGAGAGTGTNTVGDHPQQVLMIVSDGVADEPNSGGSRIYTPLGSSTNLSAWSTQACTTIKSNPNVRIAVLYLVYNPLPLNNGNSWYAQKISGEQPEISPVMQNCASPGLFYQVNTGGDVTSALNSLFQSAVKSAHLSN